MQISMRFDPVPPIISHPSCIPPATTVLSQWRDDMGKRPHVIPILIEPVRALHSLRPFGEPSRRMIGGPVQQPLPHRLSDRQRTCPGEP